MEYGPIFPLYCRHLLGTVIASSTRRACALGELDKREQEKSIVPGKEGSKIRLCSEEHGAVSVGVFKASSEEALLVAHPTLGRLLVVVCASVPNLPPELS